MELFALYAGATKKHNLLGWEMENAITRGGNGATEGGEETEVSGVAEFIASMCSDLTQMARTSGFETLAFILDMAVQEAEQQSEDDAD